MVCKDLTPRGLVPVGQRSRSPATLTVCRQTVEVPSERITRHSEKGPIPALRAGSLIVGKYRPKRRVSF